MGSDKHELAGKPKGSKSKDNYSMTWVSFQDRDISSEYFQADQSILEPIERMFELQESGWKFSYSWSQAYDGYIASATCRDKDSDYYQRVFLVSHVDGSKAIRAIAYVLHTMLPRGDFEGSNALRASTW